MAPRAFYAATELSWEEKLEIRKHALECASRLRIQSGCSSSQIVELAKVFEDYLKGNM